MKTAFNTLTKGLLLCVLAASFSCKEKSMDEVIDHVFTRALNQYEILGETMKTKDGLLPRTIDEKGNLVTSDPAWWTSGFFPGTLWYIYEYTGDTTILNLAQIMTARVEEEQYTTNNHDVGFMLYCSFGNELRLTNKDWDKEVLLTGAKSLSTRFNDSIGLIKSWDTSEKWKPEWHYPVIIDNMMNLELLMWASKYAGDSKFEQIARIHADNTIKNHFRDDYSCYHVVSYDTISGGVQIKQTHQGYSDESSWSRGQAWALYGYSMMYRETKDPRYLDHAVKVASFILDHPNLPSDKIPYWDFDAPDIPNAYRDASAAAVIASSLIELSQYVSPEQAQKYVEVSEKQLRTLASPEYLAKVGYNGHFILKHSVGSLPHNSEVDAPLTYADYYFLEALLRYQKVVLEKISF